MFVYIRSEPGLYTVGHYDPAGKWIAESDHPTPYEAAQRAAWLNGSKDTDVATERDVLRAAIRLVVDAANAHRETIHGAVLQAIDAASTTL